MTVPKLIESTGHILRLLATHHIGKEVTPDVFANNRISSVIDSGKQWRDLMTAIPGGKDGYVLFEFNKTGCNLMLH